MIAYAWTVYPRVSTSPMIATGITDKDSQARKLAEKALLSDDTAAWAIVQRVTVSFNTLTAGEKLLTIWPSAGKPVVCRRNDNGGVSWQSISAE